MVGIIPAGGSGNRWNGYIKELLPINNEDRLIDNTIKTMVAAGCSCFIIATTPEKIALLSTHLKRHDYPIAFVLGGKEMWGSIHNCLGLAKWHDRCMMMMPDTIVSPLNSDDLVFPDFALGLFDTTTPERFSIFQEGKILHKPKDLEPGTYKAWGWWFFKSRVAFLMHKEFTPEDNFDDVLNSILEKERPGWYRFVDIKTYNDIANFEEYQKLICNQE